jgi:F-type H+-transporting ATPase subunit gamma
MAQRDVKNRIASVQNIRKITRAMEMVSAARLRRAEQRIEHLRPYAGAIRRMTRQAAEAAGGEIGSLPILKQHESEQRIGILLITADRGLAGAFNSQIVRAGLRAAIAYEEEGKTVGFSATGRRGASSLTFRNREPDHAWTGFTERPAYANAREIAERMMAMYVDGEVDRVEIFYNGYVSPLVQEVRRETLLPLQEATILSDDDDGQDDEPSGDAGAHDGHGAGQALVEYEPDPSQILERLVPDYVEISIFRALLESSASELGARMTAMRSASDNAGDVIEELTLAMNRARQAEITQEIMEVVGGAEALT